MLLLVTFGVSSIASITFFMSTDLGGSICVMKTSYQRRVFRWGPYLLARIMLVLLRPKYNPKISGNFVISITVVCKSCTLHTNDK